MVGAGLESLLSATLLLNAVASVTGERKQQAKAGRVRLEALDESKAGTISFSAPFVCGAQASGGITAQHAGQACVRNMNWNRTGEHMSMEREHEQEHAEA